MSGDPAGRVRRAFEAIERGDFLHRTERRHSAEDRPLPIGHSATNSQPSTVRDMLVALDVQPGDRVLDVGSGSGWTAALLGSLTGEGGHVLGVELEPELAAWGADNVARYDMPWVAVRAAQRGVLGAPADGPFDRILVSAQPPRLPDELVEQLADGGRMVIPVAGQMTVVDRHGDRRTIERFGHYSFVPLR